MDLNSKQIEWLKKHNLEIAEGFSYLMIRPAGARWPYANYWSVVENHDFRNNKTEYQLVWNYGSNVCGTVSPAGRVYRRYSALKGALAELVTLCASQA